MQVVTRERREYYKKRDNAVIHPEDCCSIIVPGADQSAFGLPHFVTKRKVENGHALKVKLIGVLEHRRHNQLYLFTMTEQHETGANHIIEAIHQFIHHKSKASTLP